MSEIPNMWSECLLTDITDTLESGSRPKGGVKGISTGIPSIGGEHLDYSGNLDFTKIKYVPQKFADSMRKGHIKINDVLIVKDGATTGKTSFVNEKFPFKDAVVNEHVFIVRINELINSKYIFRFLLTNEGQKRILDNFQGSAQGGINLSFASNLLIPIAPLNEQNRIVAKLEKLLEKVDTAKARLDKIPQTLKRFRQSVLSAAVSGELTKDWREKYKGDKIWEETTLENVAENIQIGPFGTQLHKSDYISNGIPLINPTHIQNYIIVPDLDYTISRKKYLELGNYHLATDDIIMGRRGEMGRCALVSEKENNWLCGTGSLFIRPKKQIESNFLFLILKSVGVRKYLESESKGTTMSNLNLTILKSVPISFPSLKEQNEIVRRVEQLFKYANQIEERYNKAKQYIDKLTQSILAKAFRGELVPQDPNDEPAEKLLERIKSEKYAETGNLSEQNK